jgi:hypothetical protein
MLVWCQVDKMTPVSYICNSQAGSATHSCNADQRQSSHADSRFATIAEAWAYD